MSWALSDGTCNGCQKKMRAWGWRCSQHFWSTQRWRYETEPDQQQKEAGMYSRLPSVSSKLSAASAIMKQWCHVLIPSAYWSNGVEYPSMSQKHKADHFTMNPLQTIKTINRILRGGGTPTYRLASSWHPHSWWKREKIIKRTEGHLNCDPITEFSSILTLWSVSLLPTLRRLRRPTVSCRQDAPGCPLARAKLARSFTVTRFGLLHFHLDKWTSRARLATPVKSPWNPSSSQPCLNTEG